MYIVEWDNDIKMTCTPLSLHFYIIYRCGSHYLHRYPIQAVLTAPYLVLASLLSLKSLYFSLGLFVANLDPFDHYTDEEYSQLYDEYT